MAAKSTTKNFTVNVSLPDSLSVAVLIGHLTGCVPFPSSARASRAWRKHVALFYAVLIATAQLTFVMLSFAFATDFNFGTIKVSEGIVMTTAFVVVTVSEVLKRAYFLLRHSLVRATLEKVQVLERKIRMREGPTPAGTTCMKYGVWGFWVLWAVSSVLQISVTNKGTSDWKETLVLLFVWILWLSINVFSILLLVGLGQKLLSAYESVMAQILKELSPPAACWAEKSVGRSGAELVHLFQATQECFRLYNKVAGFIALVSVAEASVLTLSHAYIVLTKNSSLTGKTETGSNGAIHVCHSVVTGASYLLRLVLITHVGQAIKDAMKEAKERLQAWILHLRVTATTTRQDFGSNFDPNFECLALALAKHAIAWKWRLTACDLFDVNNRLFALIFGTVMTFIMFMFQVRIAEDTSALGGKGAI